MREKRSGSTEIMNKVYRGKKVLVTGHTGFKGSWMALWLEKLGAEVFGLSLPPDASPNHFQLLGLDMESHLGDVRDRSFVERAVRMTKPDVVFHLAAQPLVRKSYREPVETFATNVMGTANLLEACRQSEGLEAIVVVTTDKCYSNNEWVYGYRETDPLGGHDPYSASKAAAEITAASYRNSFFHGDSSPLLATARAGNVIGGGDWSEDRLIPDVVRAMAEGKSIEIRSPNAIRPWQHVLDCLYGYLLLGEKLLQGQKEYADAWNFGPESDGARTVSQMLEILGEEWPGLQWHRTRDAHPHEASLLQLDSSKARTTLGWKPAWTVRETLSATARWYRSFMEEGSVVSESQIDEYVQKLGEEGRWA